LRSIALLVLLAPAVARAEDEPVVTTPVDSGTPAPAAVGGERVTMPAKRGMVHAQLGINLSTDLVGKPVSLSPDIWYGVNEKLTVGLIHTAVGATGIQGIPGTSLCLTGADNGCGKFYDNVGIDVRYTLKSTEKLQLALDGGLFVNSFDPFQMALKVGIAGRYRAGKQLALEFTPNIFFGVTERDGGGDPAVAVGSNKEVLALPVNVVYGLNEKIGLLAQVALLLPFEDAGDFYTIGLALGGNYAINKQLSLELIFALPVLVTGLKDAMGDSLGGVDARTLTLGGSYAF
jgi:hypothetical protein